MSDKISGQKRKHGGGMPALIPTPEQGLMVQILASNGTPQDVIARHIKRGIDGKTLRKVPRGAGRRLCRYGYAYGIDCRAAKG
jgi:hypothetical protein